MWLQFGATALHFFLSVFSILLMLFSFINYFGAQDAYEINWNEFDLEFNRIEGATVCSTKRQPNAKEKRIISIWYNKREKHRIQTHDYLYSYVESLIVYTRTFSRFPLPTSPCPGQTHRQSRGKCACGCSVPQQPLEA